MKSNLKYIFQNEWFWVLGVTLVAFFVRIYRLDIDLPSLYSDEVDLHYKALGWFKYPENLTSFFYNKIFYGTYSFTWFLGLNPLGVRLPAALFMSINVLLFGVFSKLLAGKMGTKSKMFFILATVVGATIPWNFVLSRIGFTHIAIMLSFIYLHLIIFLLAKNARGYLLSLVPLLFSVYYYQSMICLAPIVAILVINKAFQKTKKQILNKGVSFLIFLVIVLAVFVFKPNYSDVTVGQRGLDLAIWRDINVTADSNLYRGLSRKSEPTIFSLNYDPEIINRIFYNFPTSVFLKFIENYLSFFEIDFLFLAGDPVLRHSTSLVGVLYLMFIPFLLIGIYNILMRGGEIRNLFLIWIMFTPIASALTKDGYQDLIRVLSMMPFLTFLSVWGFWVSVSYFKGYLRVGYILPIITIFIFSVYYFIFGYFHVFPALAARDFDYGFKEIALFQTASEKKILVIWDGYYPHWHFRFWQNTDYLEFKQFRSEEIKFGNEIIHKRHKDLYFANIKDVKKLLGIMKAEKISYVVIPVNHYNRYSDTLSEVFKDIQTINYPSGELAFKIYEVSD